MAEAPELCKRCGQPLQRHGMFSSCPACGVLIVDAVIPPSGRSIKKKRRANPT